MLIIFRKNGEVIVNKKVHANERIYAELGDYMWNSDFPDEEKPAWRKWNGALQSWMIIHEVWVPKEMQAKLLLLKD